MSQKIHYGMWQPQSHSNTRFPVETKRHVDPDVYRAALTSAGGDRRRLRVNDDGTVDVLNRPYDGRVPSPFAD